MILLKYEREGSDYLSARSNQRQESVDQHKYIDIKRDPENKKFKCYRPRIQFICDYILALLMLIVFLARIGVIHVPKKHQLTFNRFISIHTSYVLFMYVIKPFLVILVAKICNYSNQSYFSYKVFMIRCFYDSAFIFLP